MNLLDKIIIRQHKRKFEKLYNNFNDLDLEFMKDVDAIVTEADEDIVLIDEASRRIDEIERKLDRLIIVQMIYINRKNNILFFEKFIVL